MADEDDALPENLEGLMQDVGFTLPDDADKETMEVVRRSAEGLCCTCTKPLGKNTLVVINTEGVVMVFCCGACMTDMQVMGWLSTVYDEMATQIKFRGNVGVDPDAPGDDTPEDHGLS